MLHKNTKCAHTMKLYIVVIKKNPNKFVPLVLELIHPKFYASFFVLYNTYMQTSETFLENLWGFIYQYFV